MNFIYVVIKKFIYIPVRPKMEENQSYWFVVRDELSNVLFSSNNIPIQHSETGETRIILKPTEHAEYLQIEEQVVEPELTSPPKTTQITEFWDKPKIKLLLNLCSENKQANNFNEKEQLMWERIANILESTPDECSKKYQNLRRTYIRMLRRKRQGKNIKWIYYNLCEDVFKSCSYARSMLGTWEENKVKRLLTLYIENLNRFKNPDCLQKEIWEEMAAILGMSEHNCYYKFHSLKRTYQRLLDRDGGKIVKWPYFQYFERILYHYNTSLLLWSRQKTKQLLDAYAQIAYKFRNPHHMKKELWREIASVVGEDASSCDRKFRNLRQTYMKLKKQNNDKTKKWRFYKDFEVIYNNECSIDAIPLNSTIEEENYIEQMLTYYIENKQKFIDPKVKNKNLWKVIANRIGLTSQDCDKKYRNLKQTYIRVREKKKRTGHNSTWPYYSYFEQIYHENEIVKQPESTNYDDIDHFKSEIQQVANEVQERRESHKKFEKLIKVVEESNDIQRERNRILQALLDRS